MKMHNSEGLSQLTVVVRRLGAGLLSVCDYGWLKALFLLHPGFLGRRSLVLAAGAVVVWVRAGKQCSIEFEGVDHAISAIDHHVGITE